MKAIVRAEPVAVKQRPRAGRLDRNPAAVYLARLGPGSQRTMREALEAIAALTTEGRADVISFDWAALRYQHTQAIRSALAERYALTTANKMLSALRGVLKEAMRLGKISVDDYQTAADIENLKGETLPRGRALSQAEIGLLFEACAFDTSPAGARDAALLAVLYGAGLRRAEAVALDLADFNSETGALIVRQGKGRKARISFASNGALDALDAWLDVRGQEPGPLFGPIDKAGNRAGRPLTGQAVFGILRKRAVEAGIESFSPHDLRRTFIGDLLDAGADISTVQRVVGHATVTTTARYDRRPDEAKRRAVQLLRVPYARPRHSKVH